MTRILVYCWENHTTNAVITIRPRQDCARANRDNRKARCVRPHCRPTDREVACKGRANGVISDRTTWVPNAEREREKGTNNFGDAWRTRTSNGRLNGNSRRCFCVPSVCHSSSGRKSGDCMEVVERWTRNNTDDRQVMRESQRCRLTDQATLSRFSSLFVPFSFLYSSTACVASNNPCSTDKVKSSRFLLILPAVGVPHSMEQRTTRSQICLESISPYRLVFQRLTR